MIAYHPFELHTHTVHSDGGQTVEQLMEGAKNCGFYGIALTDHNVSSGIQDVTPELEQKYVPVVSGIEWTTFFGHMLVLGCDRYVDWRFALPADIDSYIEQVVEAGGTVGIAHPFEIGAPICCGCYWEFEVHNWKNVDYIEIWSNPDPMRLTKNLAAIDWWTQLLNDGHHLACTAGRDWHWRETATRNSDGSICLSRGELLSATYLGLREELPFEEAVKDALHAGRTYLTLGPTLKLTLTQNGKAYTIGDMAPAGNAEVAVEIGLTERAEIWAQHGIVPQMVRLTGRAGTVEKSITDGRAVFDCVPLEGWMRVEIHGEINGRENEMLAISSPIYTY